MSGLRYALCEERDQKPVVHGVYDSRSAAAAAQDELAQRNTGTFWVAELGPEADGWVRWITEKRRGVGK